MRVSPFVVISAVTVGITSLVGCAPRSEPPATGKLGATPSIAADTAARSYGLAPVHNDKIVYQPDVVTIEEGPGAIRGVSDDGLTFRLDAHAHGADQLAVGKIMLAASLAAGRVIALERQGDQVTVKLMPAPFADIVKRAIIDVDQSFDGATLAGLGPSGVAPMKIYVYRASTQRTTAMPAVWHSSDGGAFTLIAEGDNSNQPVPNPDPEGGSEEPDVPSPNERSNSVAIPIPLDKLKDSSGGAAETPTITVKTPIMENLNGVSLTPLGVVFGAEPKFMLGVGIYRVATAGPYVKGRFSVGIAMGSILGSPLALCKGVTWKIDAGFGLGMTFMHGVTDQFKDYLKIKNPDGDVEFLEHMYPIWSPPTSTLPDTALCRGD